MLRPDPQSVSCRFLLWCCELIKTLIDLLLYLSVSFDEITCCEPVTVREKSNSSRGMMLKPGSDNRRLLWCWLDSSLLVMGFFLLLSLPFFNGLNYDWKETRSRLISHKSTFCLTGVSSGCCDQHQTSHYSLYTTCMEQHTFTEWSGETLTSDDLMRAFLEFCPTLSLKIHSKSRWTWFKHVGWITSKLNQEFTGRLVVPTHMK